MNVNSIEQTDGPFPDPDIRTDSRTCSYPPAENKNEDVTESRSALNDAKDIEHAPVRDDPRYWSRVRKVSCYFSPKRNNTNPHSIEFYISDCCSCLYACNSRLEYL